MHNDTTTYKKFTIYSEQSTQSHLVIVIDSLTHNSLQSHNHSPHREREREREREIFYVVRLVPNGLFFVCFSKIVVGLPWAFFFFRARKLICCCWAFYLYLRDQV